MNRRIIFILSLIAVSSQSAAAVEQLFTVPFENCYKDFGTGNNTWYICPDIASSVKTNKVFPTDNLFLQSLPVKSEVSVSFTCKTSQPVTAEISIMDSSFLLQTSAVDDWKKFEKVLSYSDAGTSEWTFLVKLRGSEYNSVKSDCSIKVLQNLSHVATTTLAAYVKVEVDPMS
ncbi:MAG: hypothetical protein M3Q07_02315 [Pseudobdellovibrionaceae bacterium]|nr:hypothetical protein [Pseudobdellovibrionaceae bacterium]